jgi:hypothetical protein
MYRNLIAEALVLFSIVGLTSPAFAQKKPATNTRQAKKKLQSKKTKKVVLNDFLDSYDGKKWSSVEQIYDGILTSNFPELKDNPETTFKYCEAIFNLGQKKKKKIDKAIGALEALITKEKRYIAAIFLLAKCLAIQKKDGAKDYLLTAAKLGLPVLREINDKKNAKTFGHLLNEPRFILDIMRAPRSVTVDFEQMKNPFVNPNSLGRSGDKSGKSTDVLPEKVKGPNDASRVKLENEVDRLFNEIEDLIERQEFDGLLGKFRELNGLMNAYSKDGSKVVRDKLESWKKVSRDGQFEEVQIALELQVYVNNGNQILKVMARGLQREQYEKVFQGFLQMSTLVDKMRSENRDPFNRNADALFFKAKELNDKAGKKKRIQELKLRVTGIVLDPENQNSDRQSGNRAIINDSIYSEGQKIRDSSDEAIPDLTVLAIFQGSVRFKYQDTTFDRPLNPIDANSPLIEGRNSK